MDVLQKYFVDFTAKQIEQVKQLDALYQEWNSKINVISRKDIESLYEKHVLHSLSIAAVFDFEPGIQILDLGTGGGFPGIPLAIFFPEVDFLLADSIGKKLKVAEAVAEGINLKNIKIVHSRAEDIKYQKFDFIVSRAVAPLKDLWVWSKPLLKKKGKGEKDVEGGFGSSPGLISLKGGDLSTEIQESGTRPRVIEISQLFTEEYFKEKYLLYVTK